MNAISGFVSRKRLKHCGFNARLSIVISESRETARRAGDAVCSLSTVLYDQLVASELSVCVVAESLSGSCASILSNVTGGKV